ncbi:hypothetical protein D9M72_604670 [compost metagenome]
MQHEEIVDTHESCEEPAGEQCSRERRGPLDERCREGLKCRGCADDPEDDPDVGDDAEIAGVAGDRVRVANEIVVIDPEHAVGNHQRRKNGDRNEENGDDRAGLRAMPPAGWGLRRMCLCLGTHGVSSSRCRGQSELNVRDPALCL